MPDYRSNDQPAASRWGTIAGFMNIKKSFDEAVRKERWAREREGMQQSAQMKTSVLPHLVSQGQMTGQELNQFIDQGKFPETMQGRAAGGGMAGIVNPITGEITISPSKNVPIGTRLFKGYLSPDQMRERGLVEGEIKTQQKDIETTNKLGNAVKRLGILNRQYKEAFPSGDKTPFEQRIAGGLGSWAAKRGLYENPKFVALQKNIRPIAINMIRMFGEVGNLSETEQQGAIDVVNQAGLTDEERIASTKQFMEFALGGATPSGIQYLKKNRKDIQGILDSFDIDLDIFGKDDNSSQPNSENFTNMSTEELKAILSGR